jgi:ribosomal protein S8
VPAADEIPMGRRILNDALRTMVNAERRGKATALLQPISGVMVSFLNIMKHRGISSILSLLDFHDTTDGLMLKIKGTTRCRRLFMGLAGFPV